MGVVKRKYEFEAMLALGNDLRKEIAELDATDASEVAFKESYERKMRKLLRRPRYIPPAKRVKLLAKRIMTTCWIILSVLFNMSMASKPVREAFAEMVTHYYDKVHCCQKQRGHHHKGRRFGHYKVRTEYWCRRVCQRSTA